MPSVQSEMKKAMESANAAEFDLWFKEAGLGSFFAKKGESEKHREQRRLLFEMKFVQKRDLRKKPWPKLIREAIRRNDLTFFKNLGKVLGRRPLPILAQWTPIPTLDRFLVNHWAKAYGGVPKLAQLTWSGLCDVCSHALKNTNLSVESVRARAIRLGLTPVASPKFSVLATKPKLRLQRVCKRA